VSNKRPDPAVVPGGATINSEVLTVDPSGVVERTDRIVIEEPMEVRVVVELAGQRQRHSIAVTMRTPGSDFELAVGFLFTEGVITRWDQVWRVDYCTTEIASEAQNIVEVFLGPEVDFDVSRFSRNLYTSSSCGICGKTSIDLVRSACPSLPPSDFTLSRDYFYALPEKLHASQALFSHTGGLHASALFDYAGELILLREDVGRHNALDKVIGARLIEGHSSSPETVLLLSGRTSFELVQKAAMAGLPVLAAVGAPSSLAIEAAKDFGITLIGFLKDGRFNVYAGDAGVGEGKLSNS
jgi:FdhD protein